jgi:hypothetical protein
MLSPAVLTPLATGTVVVYGGPHAESTAASAL